MIKNILKGAAFLCVAISATWLYADKPFGLTSGKQFTDPLGLNMQDAVFSWKIPVGKMQQAYNVQFWSPDMKILWADTGMRRGKVSVARPLDGSMRFEGATKYLWRVKVSYTDGTQSDWSDFAAIETGLTSNSQWQPAKWLSTPKVPEVRNAKTRRGEDVVQKWIAPTYFRKTFNIDKTEIASARCYVAVKGIFQAYLNGKKIGDDFWGTGWTDYNKRIQTNTYDITDLLENGSNAISAIAADGWYGGRLTWHNLKNLYGEKPEILVKIRITKKDGSVFEVNSDQTWKCGHFAILEADIYDGETYDANLEPKGWKQASFKEDAKWTSPIAKEIAEKPLLEPRRNQPIRANLQLNPVSVRELKEGVYIFDFGQNLVGVPQIKLKGEKGQKITLRYAEMLKDDQTLYTDNYRSAKSTDYYTFSGEKDGEEYAPVFTFHGFRYLEISGLKEKPSLDSVKALVMYNDMELTGSFRCSNEMLNRLQSNIQWGQRGNFFSVPTDCPQRDERLGWTGDAQVFCSTAAYNMNVLGFFTKWCLDMADSQLPDGKIPSVVPLVKGVEGDGSPAWSDAVVICPWQIYLAYGDFSIVKNTYPAMKKWMYFQRDHSKGLIRQDCGFGDWLQPKQKNKQLRGDTPRSLIGTAYYAECARIIEQSAKKLKYANDVKNYGQLKDKIKDAYCKAFVKESGLVEGDTQTAYLLTLAFDMVKDKSLRAKVFAKFLERLEKDGNTLNTGFVGTPLILDVLSRFGRTDLAYKVLQTPEYPSWIYSINQGATTMWERWNSYSKDAGFGPVSMNSFNHYAYGAVGKWMYANIAGIDNQTGSVGYGTIRFAPQIGGGITNAASEYQSAYGEISSSWRIVDGKKVVWKITAPGNTNAYIVVPKECNWKESTINGKPLEKRAITLPSGKYVLEMPLNK